MDADSTDVKPGSTPSPEPVVKETAPTSTPGAGDNKTDSPTAKKASDTPPPPPGKSHREALISSLSNEKKVDEKTEGDEPPADPPEPTPGDSPEDKEPEAPSADEEETPAEGDDTTVTGKPERAKKDVLIENLRKVSDENKSLRSIQNFAAPILTRLAAAKIPPREFHQLTDTVIGARSKGVAADKLVAWVNLGTEALSAEDAGQRLYEMAVQHGYQPSAPATPVVPPEHEAYIAAQRQAGLIDDEMATRMRAMAARTPPPPTPKPRQQPPPQQRQTAPPVDPGDVDVPAATVQALTKMGDIADSIRKQHKIGDVDWGDIDKQIVTKINQAKKEAGGEIPVAQWPSTFRLVADAVVADYLRRRPAATKPIQTSLRPSKAPGAGTDADLTERQKTIRRLAQSS